jgi:NADH-quinone oxidoreductase subunit C
MAGKSFEEALHGLEEGTKSASAEGTPVGEEADAAAHPSVGALRARFGDAVLHHTMVGRQEHVVYVAAERAAEILGWLKTDADQQYDLLLDLTAVDYGGGRPLEVLYQLVSIPHRRTLRLKVTLPLTSLEVESATGLWKTADWLEREAFDMFGIHFRGHPDLRRILMPENYAEGHPLRKDFPLRGRFSRAEQTRRALAMAVEEYYTPQELSLGKVPPAPGITRDDVGTRPSPAAQDAAADPTGTAGRPNDVDWSPGALGSAAEGAPAPGEVKS